MKKEKAKGGLRLLKRAAAIFLVCAVGGGIFLAAYIFHIREWREFDPAEAADMPLTTVLYDAAGQPFQELSGTERRYYVRLSELPACLPEAFLAMEDARFFEHAGVDLVRVGGAILADLKSGQFSQGASTITQQLVKLTYLKNEKTLTRKAAEMLMALKLEKCYSKEEILELYLNRAYFGNGAYGVEAAAQEYFGKHASELSLAEAAMLAGLVKSPSGYDPRLRPEKARQRQRSVLLRMQEEGYLDEAARQAALAEEVPIAEKQKETYAYGFYTDTVIDDAARILGLSYRELMEGGYRVETYLDPVQQAYLEEYAAAAENFPAAAEDGEPCQCAAVLLSAKTNGIAALVGGRTHETRLAFNRARAMRRQPGSAIKPVLVYAPAIEYLQYQTTSLLLDEPEDFDGYTPRDAGNTYRGWVTLRDAAAYSLNLPAVRLLREVGVDRAKGYASSVGIPFAEQDANLSLALGGFTTGVSPLELAASYMPFAAGGYYDAPSTVRRILDSAGHVVYERPEAAKSVLSEQTAFLMDSLLQSGVEYGTSKALQAAGVPLAAKTGTSSYDDASNNKDAWIVAYNPEYIFCGWIGFDNSDGAHFLEKGVTGGTYPAKMAAGVFSKLYEGRQAPAFSAPASIAAVAVDAAQLRDKLTLRPAAEDRESQTEYYCRDSIPEELSPKVRDMQVDTAGGKPRIRFSASQGYTYALERREVGRGGFILLTRIQGGGAYVDETAEAGKTYLYRLLPEEFYTAAYAAVYLYIPAD